MQTIRRLAGVIVAILLVASSLSVPSTVNAKPIADLDRMSVDDQARYVITLLDGSVGYLHSQKQDDMAHKVINHFNAKGSKGMQEFLNNLDIARGAARETGKPIEVEHAMILTLRELGVDVPKGVMMRLARDFKETPRK